MDYEYTFYVPGSTEDAASTLRNGAPLAHIQAGNSLLLAGAAAGPAPGYHVLIKHVEAYLYAPIDNAAAKMHVHVFTTEYDRLSLRERLASASA
jgi:hypothetical protein